MFVPLHLSHCEVNNQCSGREWLCCIKAVKKPHGKTMFFFPLSYLFCCLFPLPLASVPSSFCTSHCPVLRQTLEGIAPGHYCLTPVSYRLSPLLCCPRLRSRAWQLFELACPSRLAHSLHSHSHTVSAIYCISLWWIWMFGAQCRVMWEAQIQIPHNALSKCHPLLHYSCI